MPLKATSSETVVILLLAPDEHFGQCKDANHHGQQVEAREQLPVAEGEPHLAQDRVPAYGGQKDADHPGHQAFDNRASRDRHDTGHPQQDQCKGLNRTEL